MFAVLYPLSNRRLEPRPALVGLTLLLGSGPLGCDLESTFWNTDECSTTTEVATSNSSASIPAKYCRAQAFADKNSQGSSLSLEWIPATTTPGFDAPPSSDFTGALFLHINDAVSVEVGYPLRIALDCAPVIPTEGVCATLTYYPNSSPLHYVSGRFDLSDYEFSPHGDRDSSSKLTLRGRVAARGADGSILRGTVGVSAQGRAATSGSGPGGGSCKSNSCENLAHDGTIAGTYCASACACYYCGDTQCESENKAQAQKLGTTCHY